MTSMKHTRSVAMYGGLWLLMSCLLLHASHAGGQDSRPASRPASRPRTLPATKVNVLHLRDYPVDVGKILSLVPLPDGRHVILNAYHYPTRHERIVSYDMKTGKVAITYVDRKIPPMRLILRLTPDASKLVLMTRDRSRLKVYDVKKGNLLSSPGEKKRKLTIFDYVLSTDSKSVLVGLMGASVERWDLETGKVLASTKIDGLPKDARFRVSPLAKAGKVLVVAHLDKEKGWPTPQLLAVCDMASGKVEAKATVRDAFCQPSPCGTRVLVRRTGKSRSVETWNAATLRKTSSSKMNFKTMENHFSRDGRRLFLQEYMLQFIVVWDVETGRPITDFHIPGKNSGVGVIAGPDGMCTDRFNISPDGRVLASVSGPWIQGALAPRKLVLYDTSPLMARKEKKAE